MLSRAAHHKLLGDGRAHGQAHAGGGHGAHHQAEGRPLGPRQHRLRALRHLHVPAGAAGRRGVRRGSSSARAPTLYHCGRQSLAACRACLRPAGRQHSQAGGSVCNTGLREALRVWAGVRRAPQRDGGRARAELEHDLRVLRIVVRRACDQQRFALLVEQHLARACRARSDARAAWQADSISTFQALASAAGGRLAPRGPQASTQQQRPPAHFSSPWQSEALLQPQGSFGQADSGHQGGSERGCGSPAPAGAPPRQCRISRRIPQPTPKCPQPMHSACSDAQGARWAQRRPTLLVHRRAAPGCESGRAQRAMQLKPPEAMPAPPPAAPTGGARCCAQR